MPCGIPGAGGCGRRRGIEILANIVILAVHGVLWCVFLPSLLTVCLLACPQPLSVILQQLVQQAGLGYVDPVQRKFDPVPILLSLANQAVHLLGGVLAD